MLKFIIALVVCAGCVDGGKAEKDRESFTFKLPTDIQPDSVSGLDVVLESDSLPPPEGFYIELFAVVPAKDKKGKPRLLPLGGQDVFKPLKKGETTTVYLNAPVRDVWLLGRTGEELKLQFQVKAANPNREKPNVSLRIVDVKATFVKS